MHRHTDRYTDGRTDRHSSNVLEFRADRMSPRNVGSQINISMRPTGIDKTNIHIHTYLEQTPEIGQGQGRFLSCGARKQEQT